MHACVLSENHLVWNVQLGGHPTPYTAGQMNGAFAWKANELVTATTEACSRVATAPGAVILGAKTIPSRNLAASSGSWTDSSIGTM